jgi:hypothetical protein
MYGVIYGQEYLGLARAAVLAAALVVGATHPRHPILDRHGRESVARDGFVAGTFRSGLRLPALGQRHLSMKCQLLDHFIRPPQQRLRDRRRERLGGLEVDHQLVTRVAGAVYATTSSGGSAASSHLSSSRAPGYASSGLQRRGLSGRCRLRCTA